MSIVAGTLGGHALQYAASGLEVFPLNPNKTPKTMNGMKDATGRLDIVEFWWAQWSDALIGCRIPKDAVLLDIDPKHGGMITWKALRDIHGNLPVTRAHKSGRGDGGGHLWFMRPDGQLSIKGLNRWAREHGTGEAAGKHSWVSGIDILHHGHRYTILPPSPHPHTRQPYLWVPGAGLDIPEAVMPAWLVELITDQPGSDPAPGPTQRNADPGSIADWFSANWSWSDLLIPEGWTLLGGGNGDSDGSRWRHPNATSPISATIRHDCLFVYSTNTDFAPTGDGDPHGYTRFAAYAVLAHRGDQRAAARQARMIKDGVSAKADDWAWVGGLTNGTGRPAGACPVTSEEEKEPEPAWPELGVEAFHGPLGQVVRALEPHTEADPAGLLMSLLTYFACTVGSGPHFMLSGGRQTARLFTLVIGNTSTARKGSAESMARKIIGIDDSAITTTRRMNGLNSGEGLIEAVRDAKWGKDKNGNEVLLDSGVDDKRLLLFESEFAGRLMPAIRRQGSTVSALLRMAWDEGDLQTMNAKNPLRATNAHICVLGNTTVDELVDVVTGADISGGLLNRFLFCAVRAVEKHKRLPFGGQLNDKEFELLARPLSLALQAARKRSQFTFGASCQDTWPEAYNILMDDTTEGPLGHMTARGPVQVQRLALVYALLDSAKAIEQTHLAAGMAVWAYSKESAKRMLAGDGTLTGDADQDRMLRVLEHDRRAWGATELRRALGNWGGARLAAVRGRLEKAGAVQVWRTARPGGGRPETWVEIR